MVHHSALVVFGVAHIKKRNNAGVRGAARPGDVSLIAQILVAL